MSRRDIQVTIRHMKERREKEMLDSDPPPGQHWLETGLPDFRGPEIGMAR